MHNSISQVRRSVEGCRWYVIGFSRSLVLSLSMAGAVSTAAKVLPDNVAKPVNDACSSVMKDMKGVAGGICTDATKKLGDATKSACNAIAG